METMLCIHLQQWNALSDPGMEELLHELASIRLFARFSGLDAIPDEATTLNFRVLVHGDDRGVGRHPPPHSGSAR